MPGTTFVAGPAEPTASKQDQPWHQFHNSSFRSRMREESTTRPCECAAEAYESRSCKNMQMRCRADALTRVSLRTCVSCFGRGGCRRGHAVQPGTHAGNCQKAEHDPDCQGVAGVSEAVDSNARGANRQSGHSLQSRQRNEKMSIPMVSAVWPFLGLSTEVSGVSPVDSTAATLSCGRLVVAGGALMPRQLA